MSKKRLLMILLIAGLLLLIPLIAMQFTTEVNWSLPDFLVAGLLLFTAGSVIELVVRKIREKNYRIVLIALVLLVLLLVWAELAVGILGTPFGGD